MQRFLAPLVSSVDALVHPVARADARHRVFIAAHLAVALASLGILPLWLVLAGPPSPGAALGFVWLASPLAVAVFLSRTGRFDLACLASASIFAGLVTWIAARTGDVASPAVAAFVLIPIALALTGSPKLTAAGAALAAAGILGLLLLGSLGGEAGHFGARSLAAFVPLLAVAAAGWLAAGLGWTHMAQLEAAFTREEEYRLLADNAPDLITRHGAGGEVEFASSAAASLVGVPPAELLGDGLYRRVHVGDRPAYLSALSEALHSGRSTTVEFRLRCTPSEGDGADRRNGEWRNIETHFRPVLARYVVASSRISSSSSRSSSSPSESVAAEEERLARSNFLAHVSHELRTPLNAIIGFSQILDSSPDASRRSDYIKLIQTAGEHLLEVVNGILDMSKIERGAFDISLESFELRPLIESCATMMAIEAQQRGITLDTAIGTGVGEIVADKRALRQIVINLLSNAIKFTESGGKVEVGARVSAGTAAIFVSDTGIGISPNDLSKLGTPFVQVDSSYQRRYEGTGLGLSIVKGLAALHGGNVEIKSRLGAGTTVTVTLPKHGMRDKESRAKDQARAPLATEQKELKRA